MAMQFTAYDPETLYQEVRKRALAEGAFSQEAYYEIVEDVINRHLEFSEIHDDDEYEEIKEVLRGRWSEFEAEIQSPEELRYG